MKRIKKSLKIKLSVASVLIILAVVLITGISYASNNQPFLGDCIEFGIVCNYLNQTGDVESNFAAGKYQGNGHYIGNTISKDKANAAGVIKVGEVVGELKVRENPVIIKGKEVKEEVKAMLASVKNYSESVVKKSDMEAPAKVTDQNKHVLDISGINSDVVYVAADNLVKQINNYEIQNGALNIKLRKKQTIVLNITEKNKVTIPRYQQNVNVVDGNKSNEEMAETIIWNMPYVNNLEINSDSMHATVIAPNAFVNLNVTGEGWLVCDTIVSTGGEWHMISRKVPDGTPTPKVTATPTPTEEVTTTPTAVATDTIRPTATPTIEVTVTPTEESTTTTTVTATIHPTPTITPTEFIEITPTPTSEIIETPESSSTPNVTETPSPTPVVTGELQTLIPIETPKITSTPIEILKEELTPSPIHTIVPSKSTISTYTPSVILDDKIPLSNKKLTDKKVSTEFKSKNKSNTTMILDEDVPLSDSVPETGDTMNFITTIMVMGLSLIFIIMVIKMRK